jgi:ribosomal protein L1
MQEFMCRDKQMWNMSFVITPVTIGTTRMLKRDLKKNVEATLGKFNKFATKDSCIWNIKHNMESTVV